MSILDPILLTQQLIRCPSITPNDAGCLDLISQYLKEMGFECHHLSYEGVDNLYARLGTKEPNFCFAGHTDVVPIGEKALWAHDPFGADMQDGYIYGRGAVDMKGAIGAFIAAVSIFLSSSTPKGSISFLLTSDEEGPAINGTKRVIEWLRQRGENITACLVGEPTNPTEIGQMVKIGRRGSINAKVTVTGKAGHVAYPHFAANPIPPLMSYLQHLIETPLDSGMDNFDPSHLEITTIDVGNTATNVIPSKASANLNIRFNPLHTGTSLISLLEEKLKEIQLRFNNKGLQWELDYKVSGEAFITHHPSLHQIVGESIFSVTNKHPEFSTSGGTSDARFLKDICPVVEFGLINAEAHQTNEKVSIKDLESLTKIYHKILERFMKAGL